MAGLTLDQKLSLSNGRPTGFDYLRIGLSLGVVCMHSSLTSYGQAAERNQTTPDDHRAIPLASTKNHQWFQMTRRSWCMVARLRSTSSSLRMTSRNCAKTLSITGSVAQRSLCVRLDRPTRNKVGASQSLRLLLLSLFRRVHRLGRPIRSMSRHRDAHRAYRASLDRAAGSPLSRPNRMSSAQAA